MQPFRDFAHTHLADIVHDLSALCALPSLASRPEALRATADWIAASLEESGLSVRLYPTGGPPIVLAEQRVRGAPTVLFYNHYDVQPAGDEQAWHFPPFAPRQYRRRLYARGAVDDKGCLVARLWALRAWKSLYGRLPMGVRFLVEGEEESGSPHLPAFIADHADELRADGCIWESGEFTSRGRPQLYLGMKGLLSVELEVTGAGSELHSGWATIAPNPAWRLIWALSRIKSQSEEVLIEGFYDAVEPPTRAEIQEARRIPFPEQEFLEAWQVPAFLQDLTGGPLLLCQFYAPTANIGGLESGYMGSDERTIVPAAARARLDFRLVPNQDPQEVLKLLTRYLEDEGFGDVIVRERGPSLAPFRTPAQHPFAQAVIAATHAAFQQWPIVFPITGGSGPIHLVGEGLQMPIVGLGVGHPQSHVHGPDENVRLADLERGVVHVAAVLGHLAEGLPA